MSGRRSPAHEARSHSHALTVVLAAAVVVHVVIVQSIVRQPLDVNTARSGHSLIWPFHHDTVHRRGPGADFFAVYHAAYVQSLGASPYSLAEFPRRTPYYYPFRYLPVVSSTIGWLAVQLPPRAAYFFWVMVLEAVLLTLLYAFAGYARSNTMRVLSIGVLLLSSPYLLEVHMGQFTFVTMALLAWTMMAYERGGATSLRNHIGGTAAYAGAILLKPVPLAAVPALIRHRRYVPALAVALLVAIVVSGPYFAAHPQDWEEFAAANITDPDRGMDTGNHGMVYLLYRIANDAGMQWLHDHWKGFMRAWYAVLMGVTGAVVLLSRYDRVAVGVCAMVLAHFLGYSHVWEHHYSGLLVVGVMAMLAVQDLPVSRKRRESGSLPVEVAIFAAALVWLALPTPYILLDTTKDIRLADPAVAWPAYKRYLLVAWKALPTALLYGICLKRLLSDGLSWPRRF